VGLAERGKDREFMPVSDAATSAIALLHDALRQSPTGQVVGDDLTPRLDEDRWVETCPHGSKPCKKPCTDSTHAWPTPQWEQFWEFMFLRKVLNHSLESLQQPELDSLSEQHQVEFLAFHWIAICTAVLDRRPMLVLPGFWKPADVVSMHVTASAAAALHERLLALRQSAGANRVPLRTQAWSKLALDWIGAATRFARDKLIPGGNLRNALARLAKSRRAETAASGRRK
jgi:hypothetical protein